MVFVSFHFIFSCGKKFKYNNLVKKWDIIGFFLINLQAIHIEIK